MSLPAHVLYLWSQPKSLAQSCARIASTMNRRFAHKLQCSRARCVFEARGRTSRSCRTALARHLREKHGNSGAAERRRQQQRRRLADGRHVGSSGGPGDTGLVAGPSRCSSKAVLAVVTAPAHRTFMWEAARLELLPLVLHPASFGH